MTKLELWKVQAKIFLINLKDSFTPPCPHSWRPAKSLENKLVRVCMKCSKWEELSEAEFFAFFGKVR